MTSCVEYAYSRVLNLHDTAYGAPCAEYAYSAGGYRGSARAHGTHASFAKRGGAGNASALPAVCLVLMMAILPIARRARRAHTSSVRWRPIVQFFGCSTSYELVSAVMTNRKCWRGFELVRSARRRRVGRCRATPVASADTSSESLAIRHRQFPANQAR
jgi:hypothetical protein